MTALEALKLIEPTEQYLCEKYINCKKCPAYESTDVWQEGEIDNCKFNYMSTYAEDILNLIERNSKNAKDTH